MNCFRMIMYTMTTYFISIHGQVMSPSCIFYLALAVSSIFHLAVSSIFHLAVSSTTVVQSTTIFITSIATSSVVLSTSSTVITTSTTSSG